MWPTEPVASRRHLLLKGPRRGGPPHRGEVRVVGRATVNTIETVEGNGEKGLGLRLTLDLDELLYRQLLAVDWVYPRQGERTE